MNTDGFNLALFVHDLVVYGMMGFGIFFAIRKGTYAASKESADTWKSLAESREAELKLSAQKLTDSQAEAKALSAKVAQLEARPDMGAILDHLERMEKRADENNGKFLTAIEKLTERIEKIENGHVAVK